jgi:hypothetical protein
MRKQAQVAFKIYTDLTAGKKQSWGKEMFIHRQQMTSKSDIGRKEREKPGGRGSSG